MSLRRRTRAMTAVVALVVGSYAAVAAGQAQQPIPSRVTQPVYRVGELPSHPGETRPLAEAGRPVAAAPRLVPAAPGEHPLTPAVRWAKFGVDHIAKFQDYSCTFVKRERIDGVLGEHQYIYMKVRHEPFSVYMNFLKPASLKGQECIYIRGRNNGELLGHATGIKHKLVGMVSLKPTSVLAMKGNRYPITEVGLLNLVDRLLQVGEHDIQYGECDVQIFNGATINDRICTCLQVTHPVPRRNFRFHVARIYVDDELNVPIRYEAYDWPQEPGGEPLLNEEYTYLNLKFNNGFTEVDFDHNNPNYGFH